MDFGQKFSAGLVLILLLFGISTFIEKPTKMEGFGWEILNKFSKYPLSKYTFYKVQK